MQQTNDKYNVEDFGDVYRVDFDIQGNRIQFYKILQSIKGIPGTKSRKVNSKWYWWVPKNKYSTNILADVGFPVIKEIENKLILRGMPEEMREYQKDGVRFLLEKKGSALLADDMGLGKTLQSLGYLLLAKTYPVVVVCPAVVKINWLREYRKWCNNSMRVAVLSGRKPKVIKADVYIINYHILQNWYPFLTSINPQLIIADEATNVKNTKANWTGFFVRLVKGRKLIAITGTPVENRPMELYTVLSLLRPKIFTSKKRFGERYCGPARNYFTGFMEYKGSSNEAELHSLLKDVMIRRLKVDVMKELPPKQRVIIPLRKDKKFNREYAEVSNAVKDMAVSSSGIKIRNKIEALKQLAVKMKMKAALEWIKQYIDSGNKLVVFGWHTEVCKEIQEAFSKESVMLIGSTTPKNRQKAIDSFQDNPKIKLFVGNIKAAGIGCNLTAAAATAFVEFGWSPAQHTQAEDRVHRMTQKADAIFAYYLVALDTVDEYNMELIDTKQTVVDRVVDGKESDNETVMFTSLVDKLRKAG